MASGYRSRGVDFDDLFDPYVTGAKPALTGRRVGGVDLRERYAPLSFGAKRADVGHRVGGVDVSNLWAAKGTAVYVSTGGLPNSIYSVAVVTPDQGADTSASFTFHASKSVTWSVDHPPGGGGSGVWLLQGNASDYDILFNVESAPSTGNLTVTAGVWLQLNADRGATISVGAMPGTSEPSAQAQLRIRIRRRSDLAVMVDKSVTLVAEVIRSA